MSALANYSMPSFFDDIPLKAIPAACRAWDGIRENSTIASDGFYVAFCQEVSSRQIEPPARHEFNEWFRRVRAGTVPRPLGLAEAAPPPRMAGDDPGQLQWAIAIVCAADTLFNAKIEAGYSPLSVAVDDTITAEALKIVLAAEARDLQKVEPLAGGPAEHAARLLLSMGDTEVEQKVLDCLAIDLQQELCASLVRTWIEEGRAI